MSWRAPTWRAKRSATFPLSTLPHPFSSPSPVVSPHLPSLLYLLISPPFCISSGAGGRRPGDLPTTHPSSPVLISPLPCCISSGAGGRRPGEPSAQHTLPHTFSPPPSPVVSFQELEGADLETFPPLTLPHPFSPSPSPVVSFQELEGADLESQALSTGLSDLGLQDAPSVPRSKPLPTAPTSSVMTDEERELAELEASMAM